MKLENVLIKKKRFLTEFCIVFTSPVQMITLNVYIDQYHAVANIHKDQ